MKTSFHVFGIILLALLTISMSDCPDRNGDTESSASGTPTLSHEEKLAGEYELIRFEENYHGKITASEPPAMEGNMVLQNGGSAYFYFIEQFELDIVSETDEAKAWSATATTITLIYDYGHVPLTYTLQGDVLTITSDLRDDSDDDGVAYVKTTWKKK